MKRMVLAGFLILMAIVIGVSSYITLTKLCEEVITQAETCISISYTDDPQALLKATEELVFMWDEQQDRIVMLASRKDLNTIENNIPTLPLLAESEEMSLYRLKCVECVNLLEELIKREKITWGNIF